MWRGAAWAAASLTLERVSAGQLYESAGAAAFPAFALSRADAGAARAQLRDGFAGVFDIRNVDAVGGEISLLAAAAAIPPTCEELWSNGSATSSPRERTGVLGCTLSHLLAIRAAHEAGLEVAVVLEDDLEPSLTRFWTVSLAQFIASLPPAWQVVQLASIGNARMWRELQLLSADAGSPAVLSVRNLWSTGAYIINRRGMEAVLTRYSRANGTFDLSLLPCLNADVHLLKDAVQEGAWLTATPPLLTFEERPSRLHDAAEGGHRDIRKHLHRISRQRALDWAAKTWTTHARRRELANL